MKDEIKEILEGIEETSKEQFVSIEFPLTIKECKILLDYITNLQEENDYLKDIVSNTELSDEIKKADKWSKRELYKINYQRLLVNERLQEENEKLKEKIGRLEDRLINRRTRIDKAIEYIYHWSTQRKKFFDKIDRQLNGKPQFYGDIADLINILQGSDK